ncbi:MAG TPA: polysaccharide deacetylase family protein [Bacteroidetes bacterium]|nr:polysaccharide deacetylase family protein [Candidatus Limimorpha avicola]
MRIFRTPWAIRLFYPSFIWYMPSGEKKIYLTFDDGPTPDITSKVLEILRKYNAKATFFCLGNNIKKYPQLFEAIKADGHSIGIHTFHHENGWKTKTADYVASVDAANAMAETVLFRPPHGRMRPRQIRLLRKKYKIVAWSLISYDWDKTLTPEECFKNIIKKTHDGSIIVFHDSIKACDNMLYTLPKVLQHFHDKGFTFNSLS